MFVIEITPGVFITALPQCCKLGKTTFNNLIALVLIEFVSTRFELH